MDFNTQHNYNDYNDFDDSKSLQSLDQALTQAKQPHSLELSRFTCAVPERIGYKYVTRAIVPFDQIFEPKINSNNNTVRKTKCPTYINSLIDSFRNGIEYSRPVPILVRKTGVNSNDKVTNYERYDGNNRDEALKHLGFTEYVHDILEYDPACGYTEEEARITLQLDSNNHVVQSPTSKDDVTRAVIQLLQSGSTIVKSEELSIRLYVDRHCSYMPKTLRDSAVAQIVSEWNTLTLKSTNPNAQPIVRNFNTYSAFDVKTFINNDKHGYQHGGDFDNFRKKYAYSMKEGSERSNIINAIMKWYKEVTVKKTPGVKGVYFIAHTSPPTKNEAIEQKLTKMQDEISTFENAILECAAYHAKHNKFPWEIIGRLPQLPTDGDEIITIKDKKFFNNNN